MESCLFKSFKELGKYFEVYQIKEMRIQISNRKYGKLGTMLIAYIADFTCFIGLPIQFYKCEFHINQFKIQKSPTMKLFHEGYEKQHKNSFDSWSNGIM